MQDSNRPPIKGRGSQLHPQNRFVRIALQEDLAQLDPETLADLSPRSIPTEYYRDDSQSIISENQSPDIPFRYSLNPYRGCTHGCSYCFARPSHEYLDLNAGLDFETKIFVKERAPELFREWLGRKKYQVETVAMSGVTDCYQPIERQLKITRGCLEVALEARQPLAVVTKNALVTRDIDLLREMATQCIVSVAMSITSLDQALTRVMEPRTSSPEAKLRAIKSLTEAGVPVHLLVAPVIPGLTDHELPAILQAAREAGAISAGYILLRLPLTVEPVFLEWLTRAKPELREKVETRIRATRGGKLYESEFGVRMKGRGAIAEQIRNTFQVFCKRHGLDRASPPLDASRFRPPVAKSGQQWLF